jgi:DnaJ homolog subfamily C member 7
LGLALGWGLARITLRKTWQGGDEEKFKLVVEAHAVLSDPQRRERYDLGEDEDGATNSSQMRGAGGMNHADLASIFAQFGGAGGSGFSFGSGGPHHGFRGGGF